MNSHMCDCSAGKDGSPCKHQYVLWKSGHSSSNFLPYMSAADRKEYSYIAIGEVLPDSYYERLHDYVIGEFPHENS